MRIAVVAPGYPPTMGGVETVVAETSEALVALGHDVEVWTAQRGLPHRTTEVRNGVVVTRFPATRSVRFSIAPRLWRHLVSHASTMDVVSAHGYHSSVAVPFAFRTTATPLVFTPHYHGGGHTRLAALLHGPYRSVGRALLARSSRVVAVSAAEAELLRNDFPDVARLSERTVVVRHGVDADALAQAEPFPGDLPTVLSLGRLERYKNVHRLIAAFADLRSPAQLIILGDGPERSVLAAQAAGYDGPGRIRLLGRVADGAVQRWLRSASVVVNLSDHEAFGLVGVEGAAAGAHVLLSDIPAHRELVPLVPQDGIELVPWGADVTARLQARLAMPTRSPGGVRTWRDAGSELEQVLLAAAAHT